MGSHCWLIIVYVPPPTYTLQHTNTNIYHSSSSPTPNAAATAKSHKITSLFTNNQTHTTPTNNNRTHKGQAVLMRNPRHCIITTMRRHSTLRPLGPPRRIQTRLTAGWKCRCMERRGRRDNSRVEWWAVGAEMRMGEGMLSKGSRVSLCRRGRSRRRRR